MAVQGTPIRVHRISQKSEELKLCETLLIRYLVKSHNYDSSWAIEQDGLEGNGAPNNYVWRMGQL